MNLKLSGDLTKHVVFQEVKKYLEENGFYIINSDETRPWGGFFVIDEQQSKQFIDFFFPNIENTSSATLRIILARGS